MANGKFTYWLSDDGLLQIRAWARDGLIDEQISKNMGISRETLSQWKKRFPEISDALKRGKTPVDMEVENALLKRALGFRYEEVREDYENDVLVKKTIMKKQALPDTTAQIFWLKNRKPESWREKQADTSRVDNGQIEKLIGGLKNNGIQ